MQVGVGFMPLPRVLKRYLGYVVRVNKKVIMSTPEIIRDSTGTAAVSDEETFSGECYF